MGGVGPLVLDAGALIALDRDDRARWAEIKAAASDGAAINAPVGAIAQAWRGGGRQALLARALRLCEEIVIDGDQARSIGALCAATATSDIVDASVALVAAGSRGLDDEPARLLTSDADDLRPLLATLGATDVVVIEV